MHRSNAAALMGLLAALLVMGNASAHAAPRGGPAHAAMSALVSGESSPSLLQAQYHRDGRGPAQRPYQPRGRRDHEDDAGAEIASGIFGFILGGIIAAEAQRQQAASYCAQRFRSYDRQSMT